MNALIGQIFRRHFNVKRVIVYIAAISILLVGGLALWHISPSSSHSTSPGTPSSSANTSVNANTRVAAGAQAGTPGTNPSASTSGTGQNAPTGQPTAPSSSSSSPTSQPTPTPTLASPPTPVPVPDCLSGSPGFITITQVLGASASLPGPAVRLTNCSSVSGYWTAIVRFDQSSGWTFCSSSGGAISARANQTIHVVVGSPDVLIGTYTARWIFTLGNATWTLKVTLIVVA